MVLKSTYKKIGGKGMIVTEFCCYKMKDNFHGLLNFLVDFSHCPYCGEPISLDVFDPMVVVHCEIPRCRHFHEGLCYVGHLHVDENGYCTEIKEGKK